MTTPRLSDSGSDAYRLVTANLVRLDLAQLRAVADLVRGLLEAREDQDAGAGDVPAGDQVDGNGNGNGRRARGHIEYKTINGCGPYAYLRYWSGRTLKSHYLGKVGGSAGA